MHPKLFRRTPVTLPLTFHCRDRNVNTNTSVQCEEISYREREQPSLACGKPGAQALERPASGLDFYGELTLSWQQITSKKAFLLCTLRPGSCGANYST